MTRTSGYIRGYICKNLLLDMKMRLLPVLISISFIETGLNLETK